MTMLLFLILKKFEEPKVDEDSMYTSVFESSFVSHSCLTLLMWSGVENLQNIMSRNQKVQLGVSSTLNSWEQHLLVKENFGRCCWILTRL
jgi:hypothetical protein